MGGGSLQDHLGLISSDSDIIDLGGTCMSAFLSSLACSNKPQG